MMNPGNTSLKNSPLSSASIALGLGDQLQTQLMDTLDERKKLKQTKANPGGLNPASAGISPAVASLLGNVGLTGGM